MADLSELQAAQAVKIAGASISAGVESNFAEVDASGNLKTIDESIGTNNAAIPSKSTLVGGSDGTNIRPILTDAEGRLVVSAITGYNADFSFGRVATAATTRAVVRATSYTEPASAAQRSVLSSSALDAAAGTGARTIRIKYFTSAGVPGTEDIILNGVTPVNTISTTIYYIEEITVLTVGNTGANAGTISLFNAAGGAGGAIGTIAIGDKQTFWAHHYVQAGKTCNITGLSCSHNGTTVGSGGVFTIEAINLTTANAALTQVSDFVRLYGQASTSSRTYASPIKVTGFSRVEVYTVPETGSATVYRASFDFFEP